MNLDFNAYQRKLRSLGIDGRLAHLLTEHYEFLVEFQKQLDQQSRLIVEITKSLSAFVSLNEQMTADMQRLQKRGREDAIVESVAPDPEEYQ